MVHDDDFTFLAEGEDMQRITKLMTEWYEIKVRAMMGLDANDDKEVVILGRTVRWLEDRNEYEADDKHRRLLMEKFGVTEDSKVITSNGKFEEAKGEEWELEAEAENTQN